MQIRTFLKRSYEKTKANLLFIFTRFVAYFSKLLSSYVVSWSRLSFSFLHPCKESNVSCFVDTVNFTIFQNVIAWRVYIFSGCERIFYKEQFFLFVTLKACFWSPKASALDENESEKYTLTIFLFLMCSANIDSSNTSSSSRTLL